MTVYLKAHERGVGLNREVAELFHFPGGEVHLKDVGDHRSPTTAWIADVRFHNADDLVAAAQLANVAHSHQAPFVLFLPYLPAARADKGLPLGCRVYADIINAMNPQQVVGIDPHSPMMGRYLRNLTSLSPGPLIHRALSEAGHLDRYDGVIAPDKGAHDRAMKVAVELDIDYYEAQKIREFDTGKILSIQIEKLPGNGKYLVVDDICDGGGTFIGLANALGLDNTQLGLWVTHGIFSGNAPVLRRSYQHIYTTDSHPGHARIGCATMVVPTETYMLQNMSEKG